jgi:lipoate---protein ligase
MKYLDLTLPTPAANLACDEALLDLCETGTADEVLRFWESTQTFVVVGYANQVAREVNLALCHQQNIPVLRRCSGGGTVVQAPGCLSFALVLRIDEAGPLSTIPGTNACIMRKHQQVFQKLLRQGALPDTVDVHFDKNAPGVQIQGHTDLALDHLKFSGNAQRRRRHYLLFHGTFLLDCDLPLISQLLPHPSREPDYRAGRPHSKFITNAPLSPATVKQVLRDAWGAHEPWPDAPWPAIEQLVRERYSSDLWNLRS